MNWPPRKTSRRGERVENEVCRYNIAGAQYHGGGLDRRLSLVGMQEASSSLLRVRPYQTEENACRFRTCR